jgi:hypothetical protein
MSNVRPESMARINTIEQAEQFIAEQAQKAADEAEIAEAFKKDENEANE